MSEVDQLRHDIEDHARRVGDARRRYRRDILSLTTWPGLDLERAMWMLPARERFTKEARALRLEAAELAAKGRALSSHPAQPDIEDVEVLVVGWHEDRDPVSVFQAVRKSGLRIPRH